MKLGIHLVDFRGPGGAAETAARLSDVARAAETAGCDHLSVMDHYFQMDNIFPVDDPMLEGYTTLGFLAARTERLRLHVLATGVTYRHPGLLAKIVTTLDVLSGGRADLAIGAAWYEREHLGLGVPFPPVAERFERLEEALRICLQMWSADNGPFEGKHYQLAETLCSPAPLTQPHPPIVIGGGGERKTLRLVARYADGSNLFASSPDGVAHKLDVLRRHCDDVGRDFDTIAKSILYMGDWPRDASFLDEMAAYAALGVDTVILMPRGSDQATDIAALGSDLIPRLADV
ncbi:MAG TPA: LLM class F420-dependent oxidoreductase [Cryptosporangiaceae bacterium]|nr:LLM class F420-dependent oxidoreductase [Cryptosporangiaceae bacterium]